MASRKRREKTEGLVDSAIRENARFIYLAAALLIVAAIFYAYVNIPRNSYQRCASTIYPGPRNTCMTALAVSRENYTICNSLSNSEPRYQCIEGVAEKKLDLSGCRALNSSDSYYYFVSCVYNITSASGNVSGCNALNGTYMSYCAAKALAKSGFSNLNSCESISNSVIANSCRSVYYYNRASVTGNPAYCGMVNDTTGIGLEDAFLYLNSTIMDNYSDSLYYTENISLNSYCYAAAAYTSDNAAICGSLSGVGAQICSAAVAEKAPQPAAGANITANFTTLESACKLSDNYSTGVICEDVIRMADAVKNENVSECGIVSPGALQESCYEELAYTYNDSSYCSYIGNLTDSSDCALLVANRTSGG
jgi:hypothetical protein